MSSEHRWASGRGRQRKERRRLLEASETSERGFCLVESQTGGNGRGGITLVLHPHSNGWFWARERGEPPHLKRKKLSNLLLLLNHGGVHEPGAAREGGRAQGDEPWTLLTTPSFPTRHTSSPPPRGLCVRRTSTVTQRDQLGSGVKTRGDATHALHNNISFFSEGKSSFASATPTTTWEHRQQWESEGSEATQGRSV